MYLDIMNIKRESEDDNKPACDPRQRSCTAQEVEELSAYHDEQDKKKYSECSMIHFSFFINGIICYTCGP